MKFAVMLIATNKTSQQEFEDALRKYLVLPEFIVVRAAEVSEPVSDADQLPLWSWFISSKPRTGENLAESAEESIKLTS